MPKYESNYLWSLILREGNPIFENLAKWKTWFQTAYIECIYRTVCFPAIPKELHASANEIGLSPGYEEFVIRAEVAIIHSGLKSKTKMNRDMREILEMLYHKKDVRTELS